MSEFESRRQSLIGFASASSVLVMAQQLYMDAPVSKTAVVMCGFGIMIASVCMTMHRAFTPYAEWCTAIGITIFITCCASVGLWIPGVCGGIIFANWLSNLPGCTVCLLNVLTFSLVMQDWNGLLVAMAISFVLNKSAVEGTTTEAARAQSEHQTGHKNHMRETEEFEDSANNIRSINQVLLETLRPNKASGIGAGVIEELMERLDFLQETMPNINQEVQPCKELLREFLRDRESTPDATPPNQVRGMKTPPHTGQQASQSGKFVKSGKNSTKSKTSIPARTKGS